MSHQSQADRLLALLQSKDVVTLPEILDLRMASWTRRLYEIREDWFVEKCKDEWRDGQRRTAYRLVGRKP